MKNPLAGSGGTTTEDNTRAGLSAGQMTLIEHLGELRTRIIRSLIAVALGAVVVFFFSNPIFDFLSQPYCEIRDEGDCQFIALSALDPFSVKMTLAGYGGLILAMPVILYQIGKFVLPGLYPSEKKILYPFLAISVVLLVAGMAVAYLFTPSALQVLIDIGGDRFAPFFEAQAYLGFLVKMLLAFGLAFELPVILVFLQMVGLLKTETLKQNRRIAVVAVVILGAVITPTGDPITLLILSVPMYLFYEISMLIGSRLTKRSAVAN